MSTKKKPLFTENTEVSVSKSISEINTLLIEAGAVAINQELEKGAVVGLTFVLPYGPGRIPYKLPVRVDPIFKKLNGRRDRWGQWSQQTMAARDREQAERVAWRQLYWWLKSQLAMVELGMVESAEVLMPYMLGAGGQSFFDSYKQKLIAAPETAGK